MSNSVLEIRLTNSGSIAPESKVIFNEQILFAPGIDYDNTTGVITFKETGQFSIKWWVATETTLKGAIGFHLISSQDSFKPTPGCSPIKTGQVTGFGIIDVETVGVTLSLINKSMTNTVISRKAGTIAGTKAYLLITPIGSSSTRVYRGDLSAAGSLIEVPLGNGLFYRLENLSPILLRLNFAPMNGKTLYDYRRFCSFDGAVGIQGNYLDNATLTALDTRDADIYPRSQEMHWVLVRVQNPISQLWSTYEVRFFASGGLTRVTVWVNVIEEEVSY